jgi:hypothetical protein
MMGEIKTLVSATHEHLTWGAINDDLLSISTHIDLLSTIAETNTLIKDCIHNMVVDNQIVCNIEMQRCYDCYNLFSTSIMKNSNVKYNVTQLFNDGDMNTILNYIIPLFTNNDNAGIECVLTGSFKNYKRTNDNSPDDDDDFELSTTECGACLVNQYIDKKTTKIIAILIILLFTVWLLNLTFKLIGNIKEHLHNVFNNLVTSTKWLLSKCINKCCNKHKKRIVPEKTTLDDKAEDNKSLELSEEETQMFNIEPAEFAGAMMGL